MNNKNQNKTMEINEVEVNGIKYVRKDSSVVVPVSENELKWNEEYFVRKSSLPDFSAPKLDGMQYVLVRTYSAGVHFGYLAERNSTLAGIEVKLLKARRVYFWKGAATLSQMANDGVKNPSECKFTQAVESIDLVAIEIIPITEKASINLNKVAVWQV